MDDSDDVGQDPQTPSAQTPSDWHPADVQAALKKRGLSLAGLSTVNGYHATAAGKALKRPWPALEILIAAAIGVPPQDIWPSRYNPQGTVSVPNNSSIKKI